MEILINDDIIYDAYIWLMNEVIPSYKNVWKDHVYLICLIFGQVNNFLVPNAP